MKKTAKVPDTPELVDIVDQNDRPVMVMPLGEAHRQALPHRAVLVLVYDKQGRLYLQKRGPHKNLYPNRYDLSATGHVRAGESREKAAARELEEELGLVAKTLTQLDAVPASEQTGNEFITLFSAGRLAETPRPNPEEVAGGMFVDRAELAALVRNYRDCLTAGLVYFFEAGKLFAETR